MESKKIKAYYMIFIFVCLFSFLFFNFVELKNDNIIASANPENVIVEEEIFSSDSADLGALGFTIKEKMYVD